MDTNGNGKLPTPVLVKLALQCKEDSKVWFPNMDPNDLPYFVLALCGETGELANIVKKVERGSLDFKDAKVRYDLVMEIADIFTYLLQIAGMLQVNLEEAYNVKRRINGERFGNATQPAKP